MNMRRLKQRELTLGVTLTELVVVLAIVGLLATLAVPVVLARQKEAKIAVAKAECQAFAKAEELCGLMHGYYVPLQTLDDQPRVNPRQNWFDDIENDTSANLRLIDVGINDTQQEAAQQILGSATSESGGATAASALALETMWGGPYAQPQRVFVLPVANPQTNPAAQRRDFPLDPWGNPYLLFSPRGVTGNVSLPTPPNAFDITQMQSVASFSNGDLPNNLASQRYDRYAVVSMGPNSYLDDATATSPDDIVYLFGTLVRRTDTFN